MATLLCLLTTASLQALLAPCPGSESREDAAQAACLTAARLWQEYDANAPATDRAYKGQILEVTGTIQMFGKNVGDARAVLLSNGEEFGGDAGVQCLFDKRNAAAVAGLRVGDRATIRGQCDGLSDSVLLRKCTLK